MPANKEQSRILALARELGISPVAVVLAFHDAAADHRPPPFPGRCLRGRP